MQIGKSNQRAPAQKYVEQRRYRPDIVNELTCKDLIAIARGGERFAVANLKTGEDVASSVHPKIVER
jgi:polyhydroxyalkanoate synthesis regulator protein